MRKRYGVRAGHLDDYEKLVKNFAELLWETDPNYKNFKARGKSLPKIVEKEFFGFNDPTKHGHTAKALSLALS